MSFGGLLSRPVPDARRAGGYFHLGVCTGLALSAPRTGRQAELQRDAQLCGDGAQQSAILGGKAHL